MGFDVVGGDIAGHAAVIGALDEEPLVLGVEGHKDLIFGNRELAGSSGCVVVDGLDYGGVVGLE
jgi:hypothetical protein